MQASIGAVVNAISPSSSTWSYSYYNEKKIQLSTAGDMYMSASIFIFKIPAIVFQSSVTWAFSLSPSMINTAALELDEINNNIYNLRYTGTELCIITIGLAGNLKDN